MLVDGPALAALLQVILVDLVLAGDNAIVIGTLAAALPAAERRRVIMIGIVAALGARIVFALAVAWLLSIPGLLLVGALLLFWVAWKMWRDLSADDGPDEAQTTEPRSFWRAVVAVLVADLSMSLDNVLGVAGAAREHPWALTIGLVLSVALMGTAASVIARFIEQYRWIAWVGLALIIFIAGRMLTDGVVELLPVGGDN